MIITCPSCARRYSVSLESLGEGKIVRCSVCLKTWFQPAVAPDILNAFAPEKPIAQQAKKTHSLRWSIGIAVILFILAFVGMARHQIVSQFPALALVCRALNIPMEIVGEGLEIRAVTSSMKRTNQGLSIILSGEIVNVTDQPRMLPSLKIALTPIKKETGAIETLKKVLHLKGKSISWTHKLSQNKLLSNERILFETEAHPISEGEFRIDVNFDGAPR
ncbi:MAG: zinc-ribbon and DUF3426 domain-containing protein [Holosporales bacterium]|jgi:predicted Zn finger-like uncharacterized protein|nr:zinc-ribbon and DUF3426 domain-containing protein [Holosporales bacterium]